MKETKLRSNSPINDEMMIIVTTGSNITASSLGADVEMEIDLESEKDADTKIYDLGRELDDNEEKFEEDQVHPYIHKNVCCQRHYIPYIATIISCPLFVTGCVIGIIPSIDDVSQEERQERVGYYQLLYAICGICIIMAVALLGMNLVFLVRGKWIYLSSRRLYFDLHIFLIVMMILLPCISLVLS